MSKGYLLLEPWQRTNAKREIKAIYLVYWAPLEMTVGSHEVLRVGQSSRTSQVSSVLAQFTSFAESNIK